MSLGSTLQAILRLARVALATILLVGVPLAEAAMCGAEAQTETVAFTEMDQATAIDATSNGADHGTQSDEAPHCIHGHCHHATPFKSVETNSAVSLAVDADTVTHEQSFVLAHVVTGLERPPKA